MGLRLFGRKPDNTSPVHIIDRCRECYAPTMRPVLVTTTSQATVEAMCQDCFATRVKDKPSHADWDPGRAGL